jgi:hypothetical protein
VFRKIVGGKEVGQNPNRDMDIIFVKLAHTPSRQFYEGAFVEGAKVGPVCWSSDARTPDADVKFPIAKSCDKCPNSVKGTGQNGQGTACRIGWRTAVVLPNDPEGDVMQLVLPAASVFGDEQNGQRPFRAYVQYLASHNISAGRVVTKTSFDLTFQSPRVLFSPVSAVDPRHLEILSEQAQSTAAENAVKLTAFRADGGADDDETGPAPAQAPGTQQAAPPPVQQATVVQQEQPQAFAPAPAPQQAPQQAFAPRQEAQAAPPAAAPWGEAPPQAAQQAQSGFAPAALATNGFAPAPEQPTVRRGKKAESVEAASVAPEVSAIISKWAKGKNGEASA